MSGAFDKWFYIHKLRASNMIMKLQLEELYEALREHDSCCICHKEIELKKADDERGEQIEKMDMQVKKLEEDVERFVSECIYIKHVFKGVNINQNVAIEEIENMSKKVKILANKIENPIREKQEEKRKNKCHSRRYEELEMEIRILEFEDGLTEKQTDDVHSFIVP